jgi:hypothetical protein
MLEKRDPARRLALGLFFAVVGAPLLAQNPAVQVPVDASLDRHPISPEIYGVAFASGAALAELNCPLHRSGGNATSQSNWQTNASNRGSDWYFESLSDGPATPGAAADDFVAQSFAAGARPMLTIPTIGWVARLGPGRAGLASFSISKYGPQTGNDWQWFPDAGNGILTGGGNVTGNDPNDANTPSDSLFQQGFVQHLVGKWGAASAGGVRYYLLDNEPSIWHATHRDVHPVGATMQEIRDKIVDYAARIKAADPGALVAAPEEWGWSGYFFSGYDQQYGSLHGWGTLPDRIAHGGTDYLPWLLGQLRAASLAAGRNLLDVLTVHYYPQGGEFGNDVSTAMQLRRNRSTRSLWDPSYVDETWIADHVRLVPRLKEWAALYGAGLKTGVTEYNWGAEGHPNGATAQADVLGIFGREGLDLATRWTTPATGSPVYNAMRIYRNYDGLKSSFGDVGVRAVAPDPDTLSAFAAVRSGDGTLTVMAVSKALSGATPLTIALSHFQSRGAAEVWQVAGGNPITRLADVPVSAGALTTSLPPQSVTLFVLPPAGGSLYTVAPCRAVDTRRPAGPSGGPALGAGSSRVFPLAGSCGVPAGAISVAANVTVVGSAAAGSVGLFPDGSTPTGTSTLNFRAGQTRANNAVLRLGVTGGVSARAAIPSGSVDLVIDLTGYFE